MQRADTFTEGIRRLYDLMRRVNSPSDLSDVLQEVVNAVVEGLGYGVAAISRLENGDTLVMTAVAGLEGVREEILGRRTPVSVIFDEFAAADHWGILRFVPHDRIDAAHTNAAWIPEFDPEDDPEAWHPMDALYAPLYSADGRLLGNMSVDLPPGGRIPDQQQRELLEMFVVQAGLAIANAEQRETLAEQVRLGQALKAVAEAGSRDLDRVLAEAAPALHEGFAADQVTLRCFPRTGETRQEHAAGHPAVPRSGERTVELRQDLVAFASRCESRPLLLQRHGGDWDEVPRTAGVLRELMEERGWERMLIAPLGIARDVLGYLVAMRTAQQPTFAPAEMAAAHEASRQLGRLVLDAEVRDRERHLIAELQDLDRYKGELIATIYHELKTPLTSIMGYTELLEDSGVGGPAVGAIKRNAARLDTLVTTLLSYSKVQDRHQLVRVPVDLVEVCRASLDMLSMPARTAGVALSMVAEEPSVVVPADPEELPRVVDNITSNAVKYTPAGGRVEVTVRCGEGYAEVVVADTGIGISAGDQAHLFSAFHRSTNPDALTIPGTGLGLAIARRIAELHGGTIGVHSELGRGSTFTLRVPVAGSAAAEG